MGWAAQAVLRAKSRFSTASVVLEALESSDSPAAFIATSVAAGKASNGSVETSAAALLMAEAEAYATTWETKPGISVYVGSAAASIPSKSRTSAGFSGMVVSILKTEAVKLAVETAS